MVVLEQSSMHCDYLTNWTLRTYTCVLADKHSSIRQRVECRSSLLSCPWLTYVRVLLLRSLLG
jgi:hypothetical protein